jgi:hypothetical protein
MEEVKCKNCKGWFDQIREGQIYCSRPLEYGGHCSDLEDRDE